MNDVEFEMCRALTYLQTMIECAPDTLKPIWQRCLLNFKSDCWDFACNHDFVSLNQFDKVKYFDYLFDQYEIWQECARSGCGPGPAPLEDDHSDLIGDADLLIL